MIHMAEIKLTEQEIQAVINVLRSGALRQGKECKAFEKEFADKVGAKHATAMSSGTAALHTAYTNLIQSGAEVLVPAFTFFATASMVVWAGCIPVFCDIDARTFCIDLNDAEKKITSKTRAIVPVHLFGNACDIDGVLFLEKKYNLKIIWDAAQAHLTKYKERDVGSFGDAVCYSFYATKNMTTGEGGMIVSDNKEFIDRCVLLKQQGQERKYYHTVMGTNYRMTDIQAAIGLQQLRKIERYTQKRRENAARLNEGLKDIDGIITPYEPPEVEHSFHQYTILLPKEMDRMRFVQALKEHDIDCSVNYPMSLQQQPALKEYVRNKSMPNAEDISRRCISLPVHPGLTSNEIHNIVDAVKEIVVGY